MTYTPDRVADYKIQIGFGGGIGGRFRFNISTFQASGGDTFQTNWAEFFTGPYDDCTADVNDGSTVAISRGSNDKVSSIVAGQCSFDLINADTPALYDPNDATSPLANGTVSPGLVPMRPVWITANPYVEDTSDGFTGLFYGFIRTASFDPVTKVCSINCQDLLYWLGRMNAPVIGSTTVSSSGAIALLLNAIGFTDPSMQILEANPAISSMTFSSDGSTTCLDLLQGILDAEQGYVFVDGNGAFHFEGRYARDSRRTPSASFGEAELIGLSSDIDADQIVNQFTVTSEAPNGSGTAQIATDTSSQTTYGVSAGGSIDSAYFSGDTEALNLARLLLHRAKDSNPPMQTTVDNGSATLLAAQIALNPQDRVTVEGDDCYVEQVNHAITAGGWKHATTCLVTAVPAARVFQFGPAGYSTFQTSGGDYFG